MSKSVVWESTFSRYPLIISWFVDWCLSNYFFTCSLTSNQDLFSILYEHCNIKNISTHNFTWNRIWKSTCVTASHHRFFSLSSNVKNMSKPGPASIINHWRTPCLAECVRWPTLNLALLYTYNYVTEIVQISGLLFEVWMKVPLDIFIVNNVVKEISRSFVKFS